MQSRCSEKERPDSDCGLDASLERLFFVVMLRRTCMRRRWPGRWRPSVSGNLKWIWARWFYAINNAIPHDCEGWVPFGLDNTKKWLDHEFMRCIPRGSWIAFNIKTFNIRKYEWICMIVWNNLTFINQNRMDAIENKWQYGKNYKNRSVWLTCKFKKTVI